MVKNTPANDRDIRDTGSIPGLGRFPWRRARQPTPVFLLGESHGQRSLAGLPSIRSQRVKHNWSALAHVLARYVYKNNKNFLYTIGRYVYNYHQKIPQCLLKVTTSGAFLMSQWKRTRLPMQGTWVWPLAWENRTCSRTARPMAKITGACAPQESPLPWAALCTATERVHRQHEAPVQLWRKETNASFKK